MKLIQRLKPDFVFLAFCRVKTIWSCIQFPLDISIENIFIEKIPVFCCNTRVLFSLFFFYCWRNGGELQRKLEAREKHGQLRRSSGWTRCVCFKRKFCQPAFISGHVFQLGLRWKFAALKKQILIACLGGACDLLRQLRHQTQFATQTQTQCNPIAKPNQKGRICHTPISHWLRFLGYIGFEFTLQVCLNCLMYTWRKRKCCSQDNTP